MAEAGRALHLIYADEDNKFVLGEEAVAALNAIRGPVAVCAVCGRARQGKSYILNKLAASNAGEGFVVGPTHRPCTKGIWLWSAPLERVASDGTVYQVILIDTEGIDAYDQTGQYSTQVFSLAVLLSSLFLYNQMGGIDEAALDRLSLVTEMTKHIAVKADSGDASKEELGKFSPSFIWLLRDFYLDLEEDGREVTPRSYLEMALSNMTGEGAAIESKNSIRESIRALFPERECFTLVRPVNDEKKLQKLNTVPMEELRPEFTEGLHSLIALINQRCLPKKVGSDVLNGPALASLAAAYVQAINEGAVPAIATAWENVAEQECRRVADDAEGVYVEVFASTAAECEPEDAPLMAVHSNAIRVAVSSFEAQAVGGRSVRDQHIQQLEERALRRFEEYKTARFAEAAAHANALAGEILDALTHAAEDAEAPVAECFEGFERGVDRFVGEAAGPEKCALLGGLVKRAVQGPLKSAHASECSAAAQREAQMKAEAAEALGAAELALEQEKTTAANEATAAAQRESELRQHAADELAASEQKAHEAQQEAAATLAEAQQAAHDAQQEAARVLAEAQQAAHEQQLSAAAELAACEKRSLELQQEAAEKHAELERSSAAALADAEKQFAEMQSGLELKLTELRNEHQAAVSNAALEMQQAAAAAEKALSAAEKKAMEESAEAARELGAVDERLRVEREAKEEALEEQQKLGADKEGLIEQIRELEEQLVSCNLQREQDAEEAERREAELGAAKDAELASALKAAEDTAAEKAEQLGGEFASREQEWRGKLEAVESQAAEREQQLIRDATERAQEWMHKMDATEAAAAQREEQLARTARMKEQEYAERMQALGMKFKQQQESADEKNSVLAAQLKEHTEKKGMRARFRGLFFAEDSKKEEDSAEGHPAGSCFQSGAASEMED